MVKRVRIKNSAFTTSTGGALGVGDRGAYSYTPVYTGNPYESNDYVFRWRQYVHLYETSWEARKIIRIIPEDALRKEWVIEDVSEHIVKKIKARLDQLQFLTVLKRSLMLERLLGGCLTFLGLDSQKDEPEKVFHPKDGSTLRFLNAVPISRIARIQWCNDPLSEHYMRPETFLINSNVVHVSRCLVWDGEPLFDPYDFALNNFRSNLAGFGPSKLAPVWDDIVKAVGTRQAAYQLIQMNNAVIAAVEGLMDLQGTKTGQAAINKVKDIANQLSVWRAAVVEGRNVDIKQHSASFGSVPELILTFIQILSAASDIPATRFLGQAPGGLNATGESDLENYYNVIDSYQQQRIAPNIRRVYDVVGYSMFPNEWPKEREKMTIKFPPMWNQSDLEESQTATARIDNVMKLLAEGLIDEKKAIQEINAKGCLSVDLDETDITLVDRTGLGMPGTEPGGGVTPSQAQPENRVNSDKEIQRLRNTRVRVNNMDALGLLIRAAGGPLDVDRTAFEKGFAVEMEHWGTVDHDRVKVAGIVLDHLRERQDYYDRLEKVERIQNSSKYPKDLLPGDKIFDKTYGYIKVEKVLPFDPKYPKSQLVETSRGRRDFDPDRILYIQNSIYLDRLPQPTEGQQHAGNYKKHHLKLHGLDFSIENPQGSERQGKDSTGKPWSSILPAHYGYVRRTEGADGDHVDAYIGPHEDSELVFVVDQQDPQSKKFDEHKVIFGCLSMLQAKELYVSAFSDGQGEARIGGITPAHIQEFRGWLTQGNTHAPYGKK